MKSFFSINNLLDSYELNTGERVIPAIIVLLLILAIVITRKTIMTNHLMDKHIRHIMGALQLTYFVSDYLPIWIKGGFKIYNLPLHLCSMSSILCVILAFSMKRQIFNFVIFTGVLGGLGALFFPNLQYSWYYYKYYQFMGNHTLIIIIPLYFAIIHNYMPDFKAALRVYITLQLLIVSLGTLNMFYSTNFMFIQFGDKVSSKTVLLPALGQGYLYFVNIEFLGTMLFLLWYTILRLVLYRKKRTISDTLFYIRDNM